MSSVSTKPEPVSPGAASSQAGAKSKRVLSCILCQQRKVKCDRKFPCANCIKAGARCISASQFPRSRRRRFPERELLDRLRHYEGLLHDNNIKFEPMHAPVAEHVSSDIDNRLSDPQKEDNQSERLPENQTTVKSETVYKAKTIWDAMDQMSQDLGEDDDSDDNDNDYDNSFLYDDVRKVKQVWDRLHDTNDHLLFGSRKTHMDLSILHPEQVQIFRLLQVYLENVNPLLKVSHSPTLQTSIINAADNVININPTLEALMFSIYCVSILSLDEEKCLAWFGSSRQDLLTSYQFGCQQALLNCQIFRTTDHDCLTALFLYLVSARPNTDPQSLSSMLGVAIRIAQRMGIHNEASFAECTALEAEMRRRLWWSLVLFDNRIFEMLDSKTTLLAPTWDCKIPLNVNDLDIRPEMTSPPMMHETPTDALFAVVRSELGEFLRHSTFFLDFTNPCLISLARATRHDQIQECNQLTALEKKMEAKYFKHCNPENPLHFLTIWMTRGLLAKNRLMAHFSRSLRSPTQQTDADRDDAILYAQSMLDCDTKLLTSPLTKGYLWLIEYHFPFPAYIHIFQDLRKRPLAEHAEKSWDVMSNNYNARGMTREQSDNPYLKVFSKIVLQTWDAREAGLEQLGRPIDPPSIVTDIKQKMSHTVPNAQYSNTEQTGASTRLNMNDFSMPMPMDFGDISLPDGMEAQGLAGTSEQVFGNVDLYQPSDWTTIDWVPTYAGGY